MIQFPPDFVQLINLPGYYWHVAEQKLYSIKSGILKPIKMQRGYKGHTRNGFVDIGDHYCVSIAGVRRMIPVFRLQNLRVPEHTQYVPAKRDFSLGA